MGGDQMPTCRLADLAKIMTESGSKGAGLDNLQDALIHNGVTSRNQLEALMALLADVSNMKKLKAAADASHSPDETITGDINVEEFTEALSALLKAAFKRVEQDHKPSFG